MAADISHQPNLSQIAVIIAARNEALHIRECLESVLGAAKGEAEVWVVDDASTDETKAIVMSYGERVRLLHGEGKGPGRARNQAVAATDRLWIAFTDADCRVSPDWLERLCEGIRGRDPSFSSIGGGQRAFSDASQGEREIADFLDQIGFVSDYIHTGAMVRSVDHNPTCNVLYDRRALDLVQGFDESLWPCEDLELDLRLKRRGYQALFHPQAAVEHRRPTSVSGFLRMMHRYGYAHAQLVSKRGLCQRIHVLPILAPAVLLVGLAAPDPFAGLFVILMALGTLGVVLMFWARTKSGKRAIRYTLGLALTVLAWLAGFYYGLVSPRKIAEA